MRISDWCSDVCSSDLARRLVLPLFIPAAALQAVSGPPVSAADRYNRCLEAASQRPAEGETEAIRWKAAGGGVHARQCLGVALANQQRWMGAADEFEGAAKEIGRAHV